MIELFEKYKMIIPFLVAGGLSAYFSLVRNGKIGGWMADRIKSSDLACINDNLEELERWKRVLEEQKRKLTK